MGHILVRLLLKIFRGLSGLEAPHLESNTCVKEPGFF